MIKWGNMNYLRKYSLVVLIIVLLISFQQCARVNLVEHQEIALKLSSTNPFRLGPPIDLPVVRRYVFFVDMSQSMISGPCPFDIDGGPYFATSTPLQPYDINLEIGNSNDHRVSGYDCQIDPSKSINRTSIQLTVPNIFNGQFYKTTKGLDFEGDRFKVIESWLNSIIEDAVPGSLGETKIMIIPFSGGLIGEKLDNKLKQSLKLNTLVSFHGIQSDTMSWGKPFEILDALKTEQASNYLLSLGTNILRQDQRTMGISSYGSYLLPVYNALFEDMKDLNSKGLLSYANYQIVTLSDGKVTLTENKYYDFFKTYAPCMACSQGRNNCPTGVCLSLLNNMEKAWGRPQDNDVKRIDLNLGLFEALPGYFGSGKVKLDFLQIRKARQESLFPSVNTMYEDLKPLFVERNSELEVWPLENGTPPFQLKGTFNKQVAYKLDQLIVLNLNYHFNSSGKLQLDSDGDGVFDDQEIVLNLDPLKARTNGVCVDSLNAKPAYHDRCQAMVGGQSCDPTLDSDGDSLNECEESLLGTDPFQFDTDGDAIPDSVEWIYGFNPNSSDLGKDSNSDGILNKVNFSSGLMPDLIFSQISEDLKTKYEVNYMGKENLEINKNQFLAMDLYEVILKNLPTSPLLNQTIENDDFILYSSRSSLDPNSALSNLIPEPDQLIGTKSLVTENTILILAKIVSKTDAKDFYWRVNKMPISTSGTLIQPQIDLGSLKQIRTLDRR